MPDAPDWQRTVTGPGAASIAGGFPPNLATDYRGTNATLGSSSVTVGQVEFTAAAQEYIRVQFFGCITLTTTDATTDGWYLQSGASNDVSGSVSVFLQGNPGVVVTDAVIPVFFSQWTEVYAGVTYFDVYIQLLGSASGYIGAPPTSSGSDVWGLAVAYA